MESKEIESKVMEDMVFSADELIEGDEGKSYKLDKVKFEIEMEGEEEDAERDKYRQYMSWVPKEDEVREEGVEGKQMSKG